MLFENIQEQLKQAMLAKDEVKVGTLRMLVSEIRNAQIARGHDLSDEEILEVVAKEVKKRKEAALGFRQGGREESALQEEAELKMVEGYLPEQMSDEELTKIVEEAITRTGASAVSDMGKVIGMVMGQVKGQAEGSRVSALVKQRLS